VIRVSLELRESFDEQVGVLVADLAQAAAEGDQHLDELLVVLPTRLRRLYKQCVVPRVERRNPPALSSTGDPSDSDHVDGGSPAVSRAGRPLGVIAGRGSVPKFTEFRRARGLSLTDISALASKRGWPISKTTINNIEIGELAPRRRHAESIAVALGIDCDFALALLGLEDEAAHVVEL
jgi:hypothetical protein